MKMNLRFKSGMGTDSDLTRAGLLVAVLILAILSHRDHSAGLLIAAIVTAVLAGWYVTSRWYLDQIDDLKAELAKFESEED